MYRVVHCTFKFLRLKTGWGINFYKGAVVVAYHNRKQMNRKTSYVIIAILGAASLLSIFAGIYLIKTDDKKPHKNTQDPKDVPSAQGERNPQTNTKKSPKRNREMNRPRNPIMNPNIRATLMYEGRNIYQESTVEFAKKLCVSYAPKNSILDDDEWEIKDTEIDPLNEYKVDSDDVAVVISENEAKEVDEKDVTTTNLLKLGLESPMNYVKRRNIAKWENRQMKKKAIHEEETKTRKLLR